MQDPEMNRAAIAAAMVSEFEVVESQAHERGRILRPEDVVEFARDPVTVLHRHFTWDDSLAAHKWRVQEARVLIQTVRVTVQFPIAGGGVRIISVPKYSHLRWDNESGGGYRKTIQIMEDKDLRARLIAEALRDQRAWRDRYGHLKELADILQAIERTEAAQESVEPADPS